MIEQFLGDWQLLPERADIEFGRPPVSGHCLISKEEDDLLVISFFSKNEKNVEKKHHYEQVPDGKFRPYTGKGSGDEDCLELKKPNFLEAIILKDSEVFFSKTLEIKPDGCLKLVMTSALPSHELVSNTYYFEK